MVKAIELILVILLAVIVVGMTIKIIRIKRPSVRIKAFTLFTEAAAYAATSISIAVGTYVLWPVFSTEYHEAVHLLGSDPIALKNWLPVLIFMAAHWWIALLAFMSIYKIADLEKVKDDHITGITGS